MQVYLVLLSVDSIYTFVCDVVGLVNLPSPRPNYFICLLNTPEHMHRVLILIITAVYKDYLRNLYEK